MKINPVCLIDEWEKYDSYLSSRAIMSSTYVHLNSADKECEFAYKSDCGL